MKSKRVLTILLACTGWAAGCSLANDLDGYAGGKPDATADSGTDSVVGDRLDDSNTDSGADSTTTDAPVDSSKDSTTPDATDADATSEAATDSGTDSGADSGTDSGATDSGVTDGSDADAPPLGCHPVINEVQSRGVGSDAGAAASDEFIEIYNPCSTDFTVSGWKLAYRSAAGTTEATLVTLSGTIASGGYLLYTSPTSTSLAIANGTWSSSGIADDGSAGLKDTAGTLLDSVGWGAAVVTNPFVRKAPAPQPVAAQSIGRVPNGTDTGDNSVDFKKITTPSPKAAN